MGKEIERKFLVKNDDYKRCILDSKKIKQGYLCLDPERAVRVRLAGNRGFLTVKGKTNMAGTTRDEWETEISPHDAAEMLKLCQDGIIEKTRHTVNYKGYTYEVDEFEGDNKGLVLAELELDADDDIYEKPPWLGEEVTGDDRYYNLSLVKKPFNPQ